MGFPPLECGGVVPFAKEIECRHTATCFVKWRPICALNGYECTFGKQGIFTLPVCTTPHFFHVSHYSYCKEGEMEWNLMVFNASVCYMPLHLP